MDPLQIFTIVTIVMFVVLAIITLFISINKRTLFAKLEGLIEQGKFDEFFKRIDSPMTRLVYPDYNRTYFKLNAYMMKGDYKAANTVLDDLLSRKTSPEQRADLVERIKSTPRRWFAQEDVVFVVLPVSFLEIQQPR